jgi:hypothetical protein
MRAARQTTQGDRLSYSAGKGCEIGRICYIAEMAINLKTVIAELQFINELAIDNKTDPRIPGLLDQAKQDLATAAQSISADSPIINN